AELRVRALHARPGEAGAADREVLAVHRLRSIRRGERDEHVTRRCGAEGGRRALAEAIREHHLLDRRSRAWRRWRWRWRWRWRRVVDGDGHGRRSRGVACGVARGGREVVRRAVR